MALSPASCPRWSLMALRLSMSRMKTPNSLPGIFSMVSLTRWRKRLRVGSPVRASYNPLRLMLMMLNTSSSVMLSAALTLLFSSSTCRRMLSTGLSSCEMAVRP